MAPNSSILPEEFHNHGTWFHNLGAWWAKVLGVSESDMTQRLKVSLVTVHLNLIACSL